MDLSGQWALVTGAARRVGAAIARALGEAGCNVVVHYRRSGDQAEALARALQAAGREACTVQADLAEPAQIDEMFGQVRRRTDRLAVLVNNAAVYAPTPLESLTADQWDAHLDLNARAAALCMRHAVGLMGAGGAIVNIADLSLDRPRGTHVAYCASKAALLGLTFSAAKALAGRGIRVNAVSPGVAEWEDGAPESLKRSLRARIPLGREGSPDLVAAAVVFLARHDYITGENLRVDGGWHLA